MDYEQNAWKPSKIIKEYDPNIHMRIIDRLFELGWRRDELTEEEIKEYDEVKALHSAYKLCRQNIEQAERDADHAAFMKLNPDWKEPTNDEIRNAFKKLRSITK